MLPALAEAQRVQALQDTAKAVSSIGTRLDAIDARQSAILDVLADLKALLTNPPSTAPKAATKGS